MKKTLSVILTSILILSSVVFCASAQETGIFSIFEGEDYTIVATMRYNIVHPRGGSSWQYYNYGVTDKDGNYIVQPIYNKINEQHDGRALYHMGSSGNGYYGYFDENWNVMEKMKYDSARNFSEGVAVVGANIGAPSPIAMTTRYGCVDKFGRTVVPIEYHWIENAKNGRIEVQLYEQIYPITNHNSRIGYYSTDGTLLEAPVFRHTENEYETITNVGNVRFGDTLVDNYSLKYPIVSVYSYTGGPYLPLTHENCKMLGIGISGNHLEGIKLWREKQDPCTDGIGKSVMPADGKAVMQKYGGAIIVDGVSYTNDDAPVPMLYYKDVVYLPLYWVTLTQKLGLGYSYDLGTGIRIKTENHTKITPEAVLPTFKVTLNGTKVESSHRQYPLIVYKDITYFPMTYFDCRFLGLTTKWDNETRTLSIDRENIACAYRDYGQKNANESKFSPTVCDFNIIVNGRKINNEAEEYPLLTFRDVTYFPLTWRFAVDEFGWNYSFNAVHGLIIDSNNDKTTVLDLPYITQGDIALDDSYYYYNAEKDGKLYVYRASVDDTSKAQAIYELPESPMTRSVTFSKGSDGIYFSHPQGSVPTTGTTAFKKILPNGTVTDGRNESDYAYGKHGSYELSKSNEGVTVNITAYGVENMINGIKVTASGKEQVITGYPESLSITYCMVDGNRNERIGALSRVQILGDKIYISAYDFNEKGDNNHLYEIDVATGNFRKLISDIEGGFHVYHAPEYAATDIILFGKDGKTMRYKTSDGTISEIDTSAATGGLILEKAYGTQNVFTVWKSLGGDKTVVQRLANHAMHSFNDTVFETTTGTTWKVSDDKLVVYTVGESPNDSARMVVGPWANGHSYFCTSDAVTNVYVNGNTIIYRTADGFVVRVDKRD